MTAHYDTALREPVDAETIAATARLIRPHIRRTPVIEIDGDGFGLPHLSLAMKHELMQHSFKVRGAFANMLSRKVPASGVAAASGGSHGVAVAYAARHPDRVSRVVLYGGYARGRRFRGQDAEEEAIVAAIRAGWAAPNPAASDEHLCEAARLRQSRPCRGRRVVGPAG